MKVQWSDVAERHLDAIYEHIAQDSPHYALRVVDRLTRRSEQIGAQPLSGAMVPEFENSHVREVIERPYRIIYRVKPDRVEVLAVIHAARDFPPADLEQLGELTDRSE